MENHKGGLSVGSEKVLLVIASTGSQLSWDFEVALGVLWHEPFELLLNENDSRVLILDT